MWKIFPIPHCKKLFSVKYSNKLRLSCLCHRINRNDKRRSLLGADSKSSSCNIKSVYTLRLFAHFIPIVIYDQIVPKFVHKYVRCLFEIGSRILQISIFINVFSYKFQHIRTHSVTHMTQNCISNLCSANNCILTVSHYVPL